MKRIILKSALLAVALIGLMAMNAMALVIDIHHDPTDANYTNLEIYTFQDAALSLDAGTYDLMFHFDGFTLGSWDATDGHSYEDFFYIEANLDGSVIASKTWDDISGASNLNLWLTGISIESKPSILTITAWADVTGSDETWTFENASLVSGFEAAPVPEPATMLLFGTCLAGLAGFSRKKSKKSKKV